MLVIVDGIDGSGKRTIVEAMREYFVSQGRTGFDIGEWSKAHHALPSANDMAGANLIIGVEPSYVWAGAAIREEMVKNGRPYRSVEIAEAFSVDRLTIYRRCYLPMLEAGVTIIAERGVSSSIVYQPAADPSLSLEKVLAMSGNAFAMENRPDHLIIATLDPKVAVERLAKRSGKNDDAIFEKETFLRTLHERYTSDWFQKLFTDRGTQVHYLDTSGSFDEVKKRTHNLISNF